MPLPADVVAPIAEELGVFENSLKDVVRSDVRLVDQVMEYVLSHQGKRVRPVLLFHCSHLNGKEPRGHVESAIAVELLHTATLVHDDVVDESDTRRGSATVNSIWDNKISVLIGDYMFAKALQIALKPGDARILHIISDASQRMSQGELLQLQTDTASQLSADVYFRVISEKTAALFGASCKLGGLTAGADDSTLQTLWDLGQKIGMAFQIKDDILDYVGAKDELGKPAGQDLREGKATLPLLKALEKASDDEKNWVVEFLQKDSVDEGELKDVIAFVVEKGGPAAADGVAKEFCNEAQMLLQRFPESPHTRAIEALISFVVDREN